MLRTLSLCFYGIAIGLFIYTLFQPVLLTDSDTEAIKGLWVLLGGFLGILFFQLAWYANFLSLLSMFMAKRYPRWALLVSIMAILAASQAFLFEEIPFGKPMQIVGFTKDFYLWYFCHYIVALGTIFSALAALSRKNEALLRAKQRQAIADAENSVLTLKTIDEEANNQPKRMVVELKTNR